VQASSAGRSRCHAVRDRNDHVLPHPPSFRVSLCLNCQSPGTRSAIAACTLPRVCAAQRVHTSHMTRTGHNGCLQCMAHVQRAKPECPLCRATFPATQPLVVNHELRDLVKLTSTLHTVDGTDDGWQTLAAVKPKVWSSCMMTPHCVAAVLFLSNMI